MIHTCWALVESVRIPKVSRHKVVTHQFWTIEKYWDTVGQGLAQTRKKEFCSPCVCTLF